jgi:hypothetical protein
MQEVDLLGHPIAEAKATPKRKGAKRQTIRDIVIVNEPALFRPTAEKGPHHTYQIPDSERFLGNLVEIYDAIPRFFDMKTVTCPDEMIRSATGCVRKINYKVAVTAATIQTQVKVPNQSGAKLKMTKNVSLFPGVREEFVEKAIRKISTYSSTISGKHCVVNFTLYELKKELAMFGHDFKYSEIREALHILTHSRIQIITVDEDGSSIDMTSGYLNNLDIRSSSKLSKYYDPKANPDQARCEVELHPLISLKISQGRFRMYQYGIDMSLSSVFSRHLLRHLSLVWTNASEEKALQLSLMDFVRNVLAREPATRIHNDFRKLNEAVQELTDSGILKPGTVPLPVKASKGNGYSDYTFPLLPTNRFVTSVIDASSGSARRRISRQKSLV